MPEQTVVEIPGPAGSFLLGSRSEFPSDIPGFLALAREYGPLFQMPVPFGRYLIATGFDIVDELCDEKRFDKSCAYDLEIAREIAGDGLFTARTHEPNWRLAHNILLPCFSGKAIQAFLPQMEEIARQLVDRWERAADSGEEVDVKADFGRLSMDTIGLCGFNARFHSFQRPSPHPIVQSLDRLVSELDRRAERGPLLNWVMFHKQHEWQAEIARLNDAIDTLIRERRASGDTAATDLLGQMLKGVDRDTGRRLEDLNVRYQIVTFLLAGQETTSTLLTNAAYFLLKNPHVLARAAEEADQVLGADLEAPVTVQQLARLSYLPMILRESLRLWPPVFKFQVSPTEDTVVGGRYRVRQGETVMVLTPGLHRDPAIWGPDPERFDPARFAPEAEAKRPPNAYKPFGNGQRSCIGRQFAMQEATLALAMVVQRFRLIDFADYPFRLHGLSTVPAGFTIKLERRLPSTRVGHSHRTGLLVLYGSNMGASEELARRIGHDGLGLGFDARVAPMDEYAGRLPTEG
ncbi:MAG: cytochrome P450, partial [Candidatus Eremiobacterota bacterium]